MADQNGAPPREPQVPLSLALNLISNVLRGAVQPSFGNPQIVLPMLQMLSHNMAMVLGTVTPKEARDTMLKAILNDLPNAVEKASINFSKTRGGVIRPDAATVNKLGG